MMMKFVFLFCSEKCSGSGDVMFVYIKLYCDNANCSFAVVLLAIVSVCRLNLSVTGNILKEFICNISEIYIICHVYTSEKEKSCAPGFL
jgi:hypothetical protein